MSINLTNLITNGSFENNVTGWSGFMTNNQQAQSTLALTQQNVLTPVHGEYGVKSAQIGTKTQGLVYMNLTTPITTVIEHKYYIRARVNLRRSYTRCCIRMHGCKHINSSAKRNCFACSNI